ncbi:MAG: hypothetical protein DPW18_04260 [Chloroflexi bacterium]|nr:hypothetical protein [Chloroflexota bacterium]MDL1943439.1 hypothetical protein [Chloroflexi bacterium CFX2]
MSKKDKKYQKQKKKNFPWLFLALGGVFVALAVFLFARQGDGGGTPSIAVDQQLIDYGDVKFNVEKTFAIKVTNTGNGTLRFKEEPYIEVVEGC